MVIGKKRGFILLGASGIFIISAILTSLYITPKIFVPQYTITSNSSYTNVSVSELYHSANAVVKCTPIEILPAKMTSFGDENGTMSIITTDIVMQMTAANHTINSDTFILRVKGGEIKSENIRMITLDSPLNDIKIGNEYLIFLSDEIVEKNSGHKNAENLSSYDMDETVSSYHIALGAVHGVFIQPPSPRNMSEEYSETWVSLAGDSMIDTSTTVDIGHSTVRLLEQIQN
ncbi:MAG: hypothetical protein J6I50_09030 [Clostridia bacterium]|nr:hypothetical protein [Clostridia bacterium]